MVVPETLNTYKIILKGWLEFTRIRCTTSMQKIDVSITVWTKKNLKRHGRCKGDGWNIKDGLYRE